jgi:hypothetical protein
VRNVIGSSSEDFLAATTFGCVVVASSLRGLYMTAQPIRNLPFVEVWDLLFEKKSRRFLGVFDTRIINRFSIGESLKAFFSSFIGNHPDHGRCEASQGSRYPLPSELSGICTYMMRFLIRIRDTPCKVFEIES